jgi:hypothetical protein
LGRGLRTLRLGRRGDLMLRGLGRSGGVEGSPDPLSTGHVLLRFGANDGIGLLVLAVYSRMK